MSRGPVLETRGMKDADQVFVVLGLTRGTLQSQGPRELVTVEGALGLAQRATQEQYAQIGSELSEVLAHERAASELQYAQDHRQGCFWRGQISAEEARRQDLCAEVPDQGRDGESIVSGHADYIWTMFSAYDQQAVLTLSIAQERSASACSSRARHPSQRR